MVDRKKVIKGLECCGGISSAYECPYQGSEGCDNCQGNVCLDALSLLEAQEPRLLTMEELTGDGECWFEGINGACGYADCYMCTGSQEVEVNRISRKPEYVLWEDFMKKWRCWTSRPTDEQREEVKWDE